jgi:hypothetical protein
MRVTNDLVSGHIHDQVNSRLIMIFQIRISFHERHADGIIGRVLGIWFNEVRAHYIGANCIEDPRRKKVMSICIKHVVA